MTDYELAMKISEKRRALIKSLNDLADSAEKQERDWRDAKIFCRKKRNEIRRERETTTS